MIKGILSRKQELLWYWRPFCFGMYLGIVFVLLIGLGVACDWSIDWDSFWHPGMDPNDFYERHADLIAKARDLVFARYLVDQGMDTVFRTTVITTFIAFALKQVKGKWAQPIDEVLTSIFGKNHYSIVGMFKGDVAKVICVAIIGSIVVLMILTGFLDLLGFDWRLFFTV